MGEQDTTLYYKVTETLPDVPALFPYLENAPESHWGGVKTARRTKE